MFNSLTQCSRCFHRRNVSPISLAASVAVRWRGWMRKATCIAEHRVVRASDRRANTLAFGDRSFWWVLGDAALFHLDHPAMYKLTASETPRLTGCPKHDRYSSVRNTPSTCVAHHLRILVQRTLLILQRRSLELLPPPPKLLLTLTHDIKDTLLRINGNGVAIPD